MPHLKVIDTLYWQSRQRRWILAVRVWNCCEI